MKPRILVFAWEDFEAAKRLKGQLSGPGCVVFLRTATTFDPTVLETCERIVFTDGVKEPVRARIRKAYEDDYTRRLALKKTRDEQLIWTPPEFPPPAMGERIYAKHITQGRWYVMKGDKRVEGPFSKADAFAKAATMQVA